MSHHDDAVMDLTSAMEEVNLPSLEHMDRIETIDMTSDLVPTSPSPNLHLPCATTTTTTTTTAATPPNKTAGASNHHRPFDDLGPAAAPLEFPRPQFHRGRRHDVLCYIPANGTHEVFHNVLFRDYSREYDDAESRVQQAYWPVPQKSKIKTIMGHVEICYILERCRQGRDDREGEDSSQDGEDDDEDDVVFQLTSQRVAVKVNYSDRMEKLRPRHAEDPLKEIAAMQLIGDSHPNVLGCMDVLFDGLNLNVVMRYCDSGDLFQLLQDCQGLGSETPGISEGEARYWFRQVVAGMKYIHEVGICHRDLSPENVMIDANGCMIIDMGMCLRVPYLDSQGRITDVKNGVQRCLLRPQGACGKLPYMSPEIFRNRDNFDSEAVDVFTAGTILFCMITGNRSYQQPHKTDPQFYWMTHGLSQLLADWQVPLSESGLHLLQSMLKIDPRVRLTLDEVFNHPWFSYPDEIPHLHLR